MSSSAASIKGIAAARLGITQRGAGACPPHPVSGHAPRVGPRYPSTGRTAGDGVRERMFAAPPIEYNRSDRKQILGILTDRFARAGWQVPLLLQRARLGHRPMVRPDRADLTTPR